MEINTENVQLAINIVARNQKYNQKLDMSHWQNSADDDYVQTTESGVHHCGTPCCMAGFIAVSPEFQACGGRVGRWGQPVLNECVEAYAIAEWFNMLEVDARALTCVGQYQKIPEYKDKGLSDITFDDVISVLKRLRDTGSVYAE